MPEAVEMTAPRERHAAVDAQGLEHAVAHEHAVVEGRDARRGFLDDLAVEPDRRHAGTRAGAFEGSALYGHNRSLYATVAPGVNVPERSG